LTYATVTLGPNTGAGVITFPDVASPTFATLNITAPNYVSFRFGATFSITNQITWSGTSTKQLFVETNSTVNTIISSPANAAITWATLEGMTFQGGGTHAATNSFDGLKNTGITITAPGPFGGSSTCILGGWLLWRDLPNHINDNFPAWIDQAA
jgi:hypothetical protein